MSDFNIALPKEGNKSEASDDLVALKIKYNDLVDKFSQLLGAIRIAKLGV